MTISRYKDFVILLCCFACCLLVIERCNTDKKHNALITELDNDLANLDYDRMALLDSVDALNIAIAGQQSTYENKLKEYTSKPQKERIKLITLIDSFAIPTDTGAILSMHGVDSVNKLSFAYQNCEIKSALKDTLIATQKEMLAIDVQSIVKLNEANKINKKTAKIKLIKAAVISGLVGVFIGVVY